jgi:hypothetical protein
MRTTTEVDWRTAVSVEEDPSLAQLLAGRLPALTAPRAVSVTDLGATRRAFWRAYASVPVDPERQRRLDIGRTLHRRLGTALSAEGALEVRVRQNGLVGRIDLLSDVPVEVKTSSSLAPIELLRETRPEQIEQLAMYCALADRPVGRLVTLRVGDGAEGRTQTVDLSFRSLETVRSEMQARADALRRAWSENRAAGLARCRWYGRGCEFQESSVCDCTGQEAATDPAMLTEVSDLTERPDISERIESRLHDVPTPTEAPTLYRFRDLLYPRRAYFERFATGPEPPLPRRDPNAPPDLYARLVSAVESGPLGEVVRLPPRTDEPEEEVGGFRGTPYLVRTSRGRDRPSPAALLDRQPQYALELGFRCLATGAASARLILGREHAPRDEDRIHVFEYRVAPASAFARLWRDRSRQLADARRDHSPGGLAPCPDWSYATCPFRSECGCGGAGSRSQR